MVHASFYQESLLAYSGKLKKEYSKDYRVFINGTEVSVYTCRISAYPFNRLWPGYQRPVDQTETVSFVNLVSDETFSVEVEPLKKSLDGKIMVKPYSKNVKTERVGDRIRFTLTEHGGYVFQIDDYHGLLYIFNNKPVLCEDPENVTHYFGKGVHFPGKIILNSNESIYLDKDAYVYGCVYAKGAENIRIYGNGIFDDSGEARFSEYFYDAIVNGNVKFEDCKKLHLEGVGFTNSALWCVNLFHCFDVTLDGINVFGQWRYNTDGVDIVNSQRICIKNSFIHSFDDTVTVKGIDAYSYESNRDITVENCVMWCDWGKTCELGFETAAREYANIVFRNCDIVRGGNTVCDIQNGDCAEIHHILFEDIRVEHERFYTPEIVQKSEEQVYDAKEETALAKIFVVRNTRFRELYAYLGLPEVKSELKIGDKRYAGVHDITVKKIQICCDASLEKEFASKCAAVWLKNTIPTTEYANLTVEDVFLNGRRLSREDFSVTLQDVSEDCLIFR